MDSDGIEKLTIQPVCTAIKLYVWSAE